MTICDGREVVRTKMLSTMDAAALAKMADRDQIAGGIVDGPLDLDIAGTPSRRESRGSGRRSPARPTF